MMNPSAPCAPLPADRHIPVLLKETLDGLAPRPGDRMVDGTVGLGGHASALSRALAPGGALLALDRDRNALARARARLADAPCPVHFSHDRFDRVAHRLTELGWPSIQGALVDLGVSSMQLDRAERGFSFLREGPLDMRMDDSRGATAADLVEKLPEEELADLFHHLGEERFARRIAGMIAATRVNQPIRTTGELAALVERAVPRRGKIHPATRVFQALRMAVNDEPGALARGLPALRDALAPGGRLAAITFHSLEDRPVKRAFAAWEAAGLGRRVNKKAVKPSRGECLANRRARSAKLRVFERGG